jgi:ubiquitin C-terminal hydrolase
MAPASDMPGKFGSAEFHPSYTQALGEYRQDAENGVTVYDCLSNELNAKSLGADNLWECESCRNPVQATETMRLKTLPNILAI